MILQYNNRAVLTKIGKNEIVQTVLQFLNCLLTLNSNILNYIDTFSD